MNNPCSIPHPSRRAAALRSAKVPAGASRQARLAWRCGLLGLSAVAAAAQAQMAPPDGPQQVVVTATRHALPLAEAPAAMTVVNRQQLEERGGDNLLDGLRGEVGISTIGRPLGGRRVLSLRGMESRHTLLLVDGQRMAASDGVIGHSDFQLDWLPVQGMERIEVVRGPMSVLYGSEALGGVVNVITTKPGGRWSGAARAEGLLAQGDHGGDGHRIGLSAGGPLAQGLRLGLTASDVRREAIASAADARIDELEGRHRRDGGMQLLWDVAPGHILTLQHRQGDENRWGGARERSGQRRYHQSLHDILRRHSALTWEADWGTAAAGGWQTQLRAYGNRLENTNSRTNGVTPLKPNTVTEGVVDGQAQTRLGAPAGGHHLTVGFETRTEGLENQALASGRGEARHRALYVQDEFKAGPVGWTVGLRHDDHNRFGGQWSPRAYAVWQAGGGWVVKAGVGSGYKSPTLKQVTNGYAEAEGPFIYKGNPALEPEVNRAAEVGLAWTSPTLGLQAMAFHNRVRNLIVPVLVAATPVGTYEFRNVDQAVVKGLELGAEWRFLPGWTAALNGQYLDARDHLGQRLDRRARVQAGASLGYAQGPWRAGLRLEHQGGLLLTPSTPVGAAPQPVPDVTLASAHASWACSPQLEFGLGLDNLSNLRLSEQSPLFVNVIPPRTTRLWVRAGF